MKIGLFALACFMSMAAAAQTRVSVYTPGQNEEGVTYFLPQTALHVTIEVEKTTFTPGDFCQYAEKYLRLRGVAAQPSVSWKIKSVKLVPVGVPNKDEAYTIQLKDKTSAPLVELTDDGILKAINAHNPNAYGSKEVKPQPAQPAVNPRDYMTEEILMAGSTAKMAELTAKEIYNIRESKNSLTRGQADYMPKDGESLKIMLDNLDKQEAALMQLFVGKSVKETDYVDLQLTPEGNIDQKVLFRFSKKLGVLDAADLAGDPVYLTLNSMNSVPQSTEEAKAKKKKPEGVVYNVPGKAKVSITQGQQKWFEGEVVLAQLGNQEVLSKKLFDKKTTTQVIIDPTTGGILKISADEEK